ncbi:hypothetical protein LSUE1_G006740 [Lachnellula suecica]|uniref:DUF6594 domain-containing protein n=1 Tax=Lachnellula suecica TaxID=602035 RepID=A0A8T9CFE8_9HELO|nr:hypothetical protein LSUE1_G006740 [Lachnellula suecica]
MRGLLKEYNEALLQYTQLSALPEPENYNMKSLRMWLRNPDAGDFCISGTGEQDTWGALYDEEAEEPFLFRQFLTLLGRLLWPKPPEKGDWDLVATRPPRKIDGFTRWVADEFVPFHHNVSQYRKRRRSRRSNDVEKVQATSSVPVEKPKRRKKRDAHKTLVTYSEHSMLRFTSAFSTVAACLLPTIGITVLSKVHGTNNLLFCLAGFAVLFSVGLIFLTSAAVSRVEIFTATAAFSAVLVVFISAPTQIVVS